jgi:hypothetical protein
MVLCYSETLTAGGTGERNPKIRPKSRQDQGSEKNPAKTCALLAAQEDIQASHLRSIPAVDEGANCPVSPLAEQVGRKFLAA